MQKNIQLAKRISQNLGKDHEDDFVDINQWELFKPIYNLEKTSITKSNTIACYIIFAYDKDSSWLNYNQDRFENKTKILKSLGGSPSEEPFKSILSNSHDKVEDVIADYLLEQKDWRWEHIVGLIEYSSEQTRFARQKTDEEKKIYTKAKGDEGSSERNQSIDEEKIAKTNLAKGALFKEAREARTEADKLKKELDAEFLELNQATKSDFGLEVTEEQSIKQMSAGSIPWRNFIRDIAKPFREKQKQERAERQKAAKN